MTPSISYPHSGQSRAEKSHATRDSFSRASDFAKVLIPVILGVAFSFTQDAAATAPRLLLVLALFLCGLGGALAVLLGVQKIEDWEQKNR